MKNLSFGIAFWAMLIVFLFPFTEIQQEVLQLCFSNFVNGIYTIFNTEGLQILDFSSDTQALYIFIGIVTIFSISFTFLLSFIKMDEKKFQKFKNISVQIIAFYLCVVFLKYGLDKVFKQQFYLPEPNILHTEFGNLSQDIAFWSLIGSNYSINFLLGIIEVLAAILVVFKRTRFMGLTICLLISLQLIVINFSFNISVKLFSILLFLLSVIALFPYLKKFLNKEYILSFFHKKRFSKQTILSFIFLVFTFGMIIFPSMQTQNFNDDTQKRPFLHGSFINVSKNTKGIKNVHFHRRNYLIFEDYNNQMTDFHIEIDSTENLLQLTDYQNNTKKIRYAYFPKDSILEVLLGTDTLQFQKTDYWNKPILQREFNWFVDDF